jgi:hypothetical protein
MKINRVRVPMPAPWLWGDWTTEQHAVAARIRKTIPAFSNPKVDGDTLGSAIRELFVRIFDETIKSGPRAERYLSRRLYVRYVLRSHPWYMPIALEEVKDHLEPKIFWKLLSCILNRGSFGYHSLRLERYQRLFLTPKPYALSFLRTPEHLAYHLAQPDVLTCYRAHRVGHATGLYYTLSYVVARAYANLWGEYPCVGQTDTSKREDLIVSTFQIPKRDAFCIGCENNSVVWVPGMGDVQEDLFENKLAAIHQKYQRLRMACA